MRLKLLIALLIYNLGFSQNTVGIIEISNNVADGYTLFTAFTETYLINNCGEVVNQWSSSFPPGNAVYLLEDGSILRAGRTSSADITFGGQGGVVEQYDWEGNLTWQYFYDTSMMRQHHDIYPMPNGNVLILAATVMTNTEAIQAGRDPNLLPENELYNEQIIEVTPNGLSGATIVWEWNIKDHLIQDFDDTKDNFGNISMNPEKLNINFLNGGSGASNWLHINSIQYNHVLDQIVLSSRNLSEIYIIDHSTTTAQAATSSGGTYGKGGDFLYRWGNPQSYDQGTETDRELFGQHYPYVIPPGLDDAGKIILFNNGNGRDPLFSEVFILNPPQNNAGFYIYTPNTSYGPVDPEYIYEAPTPTDFFSQILSSAQRLPNGNTLICEGINGRFFEIDTNENVVWQYINPVDNITGEIAGQGDNAAPISNLSFRAIKYPTNYPAFIGRDLTPSDPIEINPDLSPCNILSVGESQLSDLSVYPNPASDFLNVKSKQSIDKLEVLSIAGKYIKEVKKSNTMDISNISTGLYFLIIYSDEKVTTKKFIKK